MSCGLFQIPKKARICTRNFPGYALADLERDYGAGAYRSVAVVAVRGIANRNRSDFASVLLLACCSAELQESDTEPG